MLVGGTRRGDWWEPDRGLLLSAMFQGQRGLSFRPPLPPGKGKRGRLLQEPKSKAPVPLMTLVTLSPHGACCLWVSTRKTLINPHGGL